MNYHESSSSVKSWSNVYEVTGQSIRNAIRCIERYSKKCNVSRRQRRRCKFLIEELRATLSKTRRLATKGSWKDAKLAVTIVFDNLDKLIVRDNRSKFAVAVGNKIRLRLNRVEESICFAEYLRLEYWGETDDRVGPSWDDWDEVYDDDDDDDVNEVYFQELLG